ncbi:MAG: CDP-2,3-bis-(O-geranylgeranyl)-sn-glycerol synthase [Candidatus Nanoarchaeia archaeon]|jgi:CDP-2,3-bis-(O-geranylgeranyl)-sn-glycerol synthase
MLDILISAVQIFLPAAFANGAPTFLINYKKHSIDFGKKWGKNRIFGEGKTFEGLIFAVFIAFLTGLLVRYAYFYLNLPWINITPFGYAFIGLGAMIGDLAGSFIKRRLNMRRGQKAGLLDMMDFIVGALIFARILVIYSYGITLFVLIVTPIFHRLTNIWGYNVGIKKEPW